MDDEFRRNNLKTWLEDMGVLYLGAIALAVVGLVIGWLVLGIQD